MAERTGNAGGGVHLTPVRATILAALMAFPAAASAADKPVMPMVTFDQVLADPALRTAVAVLPPADQAVLGEAAHGWVQTPLMQHGPVRYTSACRPHVCERDRIDIVYGADGRVWIGVVEDRHLRLVGNPPSDVCEVFGR